MSTSITTPTTTPQTPDTNTQPNSPSPLPQEEIFHLSDGRSLGWKQYGQPTGLPTFFFHGSPSSRLEGLEWHAAALNTGVRLIALDRWGMGLSSLHPSPSLTAWPSDVLSLSKALGLSSFHVLGSSGGGPYALACARELPADVLLGTGVVSGVGPPAAGTRGAAWDRRVAFWVNRWVPGGVVEWMLNVGIGRMARGGSDAEWEAHGEKLIGTLSEEEKVYYKEHEGEKKALVECYREAFRQGSKGAVVDAKLVLKEWGFGLEDVKGKVKIWNGTGDVNVPVQSARWMADKISAGGADVVLKEFEGDTHLSTQVKHSGDILRDLIELRR